MAELNVNENTSAGVNTPPTPEQLCAREPIHIPGSIQPHGWMLVVHQATFAIEQLSANWRELLGMEAENLVGSPVEAIDAAFAARVRETAGNPHTGRAYAATIAGRRMNVVQHVSDGALVIECEPAEAREDEVDFAALQDRQASAVARLQNCGSIAELLQTAAEEMARISGFDRVMIYKFHPDWHGEVVAEKVAPGVESFMGLHYPASDIPEQARRLYTRNWLRLIATADYRPVPLVPGLNPRTGASLDLTHSSLRSVSPVHLEYLRNMDVSGSMSVSLIDDGRLWGLVACHHRAPRKLPFTVRVACELIGRVTSALLGAAQRAEVQQARLVAKEAREAFLDRLAERLDFVQAIVDEGSQSLGVMNAGSAVVAAAGQVRTVGTLLDDALLSECLAWLRTQSGDLVETTQLSAHIPAAAAHRETASGLFAIALTETSADWLIWFRPEHAHSVNWAGNPDKSLQDLSLPIQPRKSFALWTQQVTGISAPWTDVDRATAVELRAAINASIRKRTEHLLEVNADLLNKNSDLNSFAFIASHDLREPLRGIRNILEFIREDHAPLLPETARQDLEVAARTAERMHGMLEGLLHYTRVGRAELAAQGVPALEIVERAVQFVRPQWGGQEVVVEIAPDLPEMKCDRVMMGEVIANLLTNAVKYNRSAVKKIEVFAPPTPPGKVSLAVRDNGIGIDPRHHADIFAIFRRLHPRGEYEGGLGIGLAVVKSIVERHGGYITVDSHSGGTTFIITLDK